MNKKLDIIFWVYIAVAIAVLATGLYLWEGSEPTWQDDTTVQEVPDSLVVTGQYEETAIVREMPDTLIAGEALPSVVAENCYGMTLEMEIFNENRLKSWRIEQQERCENWSDFRIMLDSREYLFSYDEFKAMIEDARAAINYDGTKAISSQPLITICDKHH